MLATLLKPLNIRAFANVYFLIGVAILLASCAQQQPSPSEPTATLQPKLLVLNLEKYNRQGDLLPTNLYDDELELIFSIAPGRLLPELNLFNVAGDYNSSDGLSWSSPTDGRQINLQLPALLGPLADTAKDSTIAISPIDTKVASLFGYHSYPHYQGQLGKGQFVDSQTGEQVMLVFFDKPAQIDYYDSQLAIEQPGWHWLQFFNANDGDPTITNYSGNISDIEYRLTVENTVSF